MLFDAFVLFYFVSFCLALSYLTAHGRVGAVLPRYVLCHAHLNTSTEA